MSRSPTESSRAPNPQATTQSSSRATTPRSDSSGTACPSTETAITEFGLNVSRTSRIATFQPISRRMIFAPPAVEPAQPPTNIRRIECRVGETRPGGEVGGREAGGREQRDHLERAIEQR